MSSPPIAPTAEALFESGRVGEALDAWRSMAEADPAAVRPRARVAACLIALGRFDEAIEILEPLAVAAPDQPLVLYRLAICRAVLGEDAAALDALDAAANAGLRPASGIDAEPSFDALRHRARFVAVRGRLDHNDRATATDAAFRSFDFWIGSWEARTEDGVLQGHNRIESVLGGAALIERWSGVTGFRGTSLNRYDRRTDRWRQTWVDDQGDVLEFEDGLATPGRVQFHATDPDGGRRRLTFVSQGPDALRQTSERSTGPDAPWTVEYDFFYRRIADADEESSAATGR
jgi:hypothetical protein